MATSPSQRRGSSADARVTEFAATEASLPADFDPSRPADSGIDNVPDAGAADTPGDSAVERRPTLSHIGRYALKGLIAQGGLGQVHEAWDPMLSRTVAVKTLHFVADTPSGISMDGLILDEARAVAGLSHPHIVTVHDAGLSDRGVYIAMERLHGQDLRQRLAAGWAPTPQQAALLVRRIADALAYAHARGVVHCDIKPANIFLNPRDKPKVLDFGIARVAHRSRAPVLDGAVAGSPHYLAPEQLQGGTVDARTDIYALGVVFYELLTLRKAFTGDSVEQITTAVLTNHPAPADELRAGVPRSLAAIAAQAMARDAADRHACADDLASELRRWLAGHPAPRQRGRTAARAGGPGAARKPGPRGSLHRVPLWAAAGVVSAVAVGVAVWAWRPAPEAPAPRAAAPGAAAPPAPSTAAEPAAVAAPLPAAEPGETTGAPGLAGSAAGAAAAALPTTAAAARPVAGRKTPTAPRDTRLPVTAVVVTGLLQLAISPWGHVEIDGTPAGTTPPLTRLNLTEGSHTISVRNEDFPVYTTTVEVTADRPVTVRHRFGP